MLYASSASVQMCACFRLSFDISPKNDTKEYEMQSIPYANVVGSLMFSLICTRLNIAYVVSLVSIFMSNLGKVY